MRNKCLLAIRDGVLEQKSRLHLHRRVRTRRGPENLLMERLVASVLVGDRLFAVPPLYKRQKMEGFPVASTLAANPSPA